VVYRENFGYMTGTVTGYSADTIGFPNTPLFTKTAGTALVNRRWRFVSFLVALGMIAFLWGQSCLTLRDNGVALPDIIVFPGFAFGVSALILAGCLSVFRGTRTRLSAKAGLALLSILSCWSLVHGHFTSALALREAMFTYTGIGVWVAYLLFLPGQNRGFWVYFRRHLFVIYKLSLLLQVCAILLLLLGDKGLIRVNFSTSISLFILGWGILESNKSFVRWGLVGTLLFCLHSLIINQRETLLLPLEFLAFLLPVYLMRSLPGKKRSLTGKLMRLMAVVYLLVILVPVLYLAMSAKEQRVFSKANIGEDTRSMVLKDYMESDMTDPENFLFGKGVNGFFKSKLRTSPLGGRGTSNGIEVGYLQMVLNVGVLYVIIMVLMGLLPAVRGILKSPDPLVISSGLWVLTRLINMSMAAVPRTEFAWFLFWLCIGVLHSKERMSENAALTAEPAR
jgi:hypothetical protein